MTDAWLILLALVSLNVALAWRVLRDGRRAVIYVCAWWFAVQWVMFLLV